MKKTIRAVDGPEIFIKIVRQLQREYCDLYNHLVLNILQRTMFHTRNLLMDEENIDLSLRF